MMLPSNSLWLGHRKLNRNEWQQAMGYDRQLRGLMQTSRRFRPDPDSDEEDYDLSMSALWDPQRYHTYGPGFGKLNPRGEINMVQAEIYALME